MGLPAYGLTTTPTTTRPLASGRTPIMLRPLVVVRKVSERAYCDA